MNKEEMIEFLEDLKKDLLMQVFISLKNGRKDIEDYIELIKGINEQEYISYGKQIVKTK